MAEQHPPIVQQIIDSNNLLQHPEGGYFRESYRYGCEPMASHGATDSAGFLVPHPTVPDQQRNVCTVMQYLITRRNPVSYLVVLDTDLIRFWSHGGSLLYRLYDPEKGSFWEVTLGPDVGAGHVQHFVAPAGAWCGCQLPESSDYTFLCEVVAPGFDLAGVEFVSEAMLEAVADADARSKLAELVMQGTHEEGKSKEELFDKAY